MTTRNFKLATRICRPNVRVQRATETHDEPWLLEAIGIGCVAIVLVLAVFA